VTPLNPDPDLDPQTGEGGGGQGKKVGAARCESVFDVHTSKASERLKVVLIHLWRINVKTTDGFINIPVEDFTW
jgi:hypothetical protein